MVMLEISKKRFNSLVKSKLNKKELEDILFKLGFELEEYGDTIKIDITADRLDLVSSVGFARLINCYLGNSKQNSFKLKKSNYELIIDKSVKGVRDHSVCFVAKGLKLNEDLLDEIIWMQEKIHDTFGRKRQKAAIGIYPLDKIKFPILFKGVLNKDISFAPLGLAKKLSRDDILKKTDAGKKYAHLLNGDKSPLFVDANNNILSMPPIINSELVGKVEVDTKDIFVECSGNDLDSLIYILDVLAYYFNDLGADIFEMKVKDKSSFSSPVLNNRELVIKRDYINLHVGVDIALGDLTKYLEQMQYEVVKTSKESVVVKVPCFRGDVWHEIDVVDDVLRALDINRLEPIMPKVYGDASVTLKTRIKEEFSNTLVGLNLVECMTFSLTNVKSQYYDMIREIPQKIDLDFAVDSDLSMVRTDLLPEVLNFLKNNRNKEYPQRVFEINDVVVLDNSKDTKSRNETRLVVALAGNYSYFDIKGIIDKLDKDYNLNLSFKDCTNNSFMKGRSADVYVNKDLVGYVGEIKPLVLSNFGFIMPISALELNLDLIISLIKKK